MRIAAIALVASLFAGQTAAGDNADFVRAIQAVPGVTVTSGEDNGRHFTQWRKAGASYRLQAGPAGEVLTGNDESGAGAVLCSWMIYNAVRDALGGCGADQHPALRADLDRDIAALEAFISANSVLPVTVAELRARAEAERVRTAASQPRVCGGGDAGEVVRGLDAVGPDGRREEIGKLLAVPRWPVLNPCL